MSSTREIILTEKAPAPIGPYSQAVAAGGFLFCSGQVGFDADGKLADGLEAQARLVMANVGALLAEAGLNFGDVVKTTIYLVDMNDFAAVNAIYGESFTGGPPPARTTIAVAALPRGARVEIEVIALRR
jgi:2-iminobutanoate/2-iminopropanoate deaminase